MNSILTILLFAQLAGTIGVTSPATSLAGIESAARVRYASNPVIALSSGSFYDTQVYDPCVFVDPTDSSKLVGIFSTMKNVNAVPLTIGKFTSTVANPYAWTVSGEVLTPGTAGAWDANAVRVGSCLYDSGTLYLFYTASGASGNAIGLATSTDLGSTWTKYAGNPILTPTGQGRNDGTAVHQPAVIKEGSSWTMIYAYNVDETLDGSSKPQPQHQLVGYRYATSSDGMSWTKGGSGDLLTCATGFFCEFHQLVKIGSDYVLLYETGSFTNSFRLNIASASSPTSTFTNSVVNPFFDRSGIISAWDRYHVATGQLVNIGGKWRLFYAGAGDHDQDYWTNTWPMGIADIEAGSMKIGN